MKRFFSSLFLLTVSLFLMNEAHAQGTPCQWVYSFVNGQATATYCGNVTWSGQTAALPQALTSQLYGGSGTAGQANVVSVGSGLQLSGGILSATNTGGTYTAPHTGAVTQTVQAKLQTFDVSIADYGATCNGTTDDTTAIQNAWNAANYLGQNLQLSGIGTTCKISSLTMPTPTERSAGILPPISSSLIGDGPNSVELVSTVTGTSCAITLSEAYQSFEPNAELKGFALLQTSNSQPSAGGYGICLNNVTQLHIANVFIRGFSRGISAFDSINVTIDQESQFYSNNWHIYAAKNTNSNPNAWTIRDSKFGQAQQYGIYLAHPANLNILSDVFEANGYNTSLSPSTILIYGNPIDGSFGAKIDGNYTEFDGGPFVTIESLASGESILGVDSITNNSIVRNTNTNPIYLVTNSTSELMFVSIFSNGFLDTVALTAQNIVATGSTYQIYCLGNVASNPSNINARCNYSTAGGSSFTMDTGNQVGGL